MKLMKALTFAALFALASVVSASADYVVKDGAGSTATFKATGTCTSVVCIPVQQLVNSSGTEIATSASPLFVQEGDGKNVSLGAVADTAWSGTGSGSAIAVLKAIYSAATGAVPAGTNVVGKVGIDQTTDGTTNLVAAKESGTWTVQPGNTANITPWLVQRSSQYPSGATAITASATGTTAATTATLAAAVGKTTHVCSLSIRSNATAAVTGDATVTGTITGTLHYNHWTAPVASGVGVTEQIFSPCVPGSATNTGIAVISPAPGTGGVVSVTATGYQL